MVGGIVMKFRKMVCMLLICSLVIGSLAGCGGNDTQQSGPDSQPTEKIVIQLNSSQGEGSVAVQGAYKMKEYVENKLGSDRVEIQVFPDAQLGSDVNILEGMKLGTHDALIVGSPLTNVDTKFFLFDLPYLFNTREDVEKVTKGKVGEMLNASLEEKGYVNLGYWFTGWRQITNNVRPIYTPEDLEGLKIRISTSPSRQALFEQLGAAPAALAASETFSALQQGVVDGQEDPIYVLVTKAIQDVQKYASITNHLVLVYEVVFAKDKWDSYPEDVQQALREAALLVQDESWAMTEELEAEVYAEIEGKVEVNEAEIEAFKAVTEELYTDPYFVENIGEELLDELMTTLGRK